jgi:hypothetical protein
MVFFSGVNGGVAEICSGVVGRRLIDLVRRCVFCLLGLRIKRQLWVMWMIGEWIRLGYLTAAFVIDGESLSMVNGAQGASPADAASTFASFRSLVRVSTVATSKASW